MLKIVLSLFSILVLLLIAEAIYRKKLIQADNSRRLLHILIGCFVAFWPYYMTYKQIEIIAVAFFIVNLVSIKFHVFEGIHKVHRRTWGELFLPLAILILALFMPDKLVFAIAMLNVALADGLASYIGEKYGKKNRYQLYNQTKSLAGTLTFVIVSFAILLVCKIVAPHQISELNWFVVIVLPFILALTENFGVYGTDDFLVPVMALVILSWF